MSSAMVSVLKKRGYSIILGSSFSNDPFVGGELPPAQEEVLKLEGGAPNQYASVVKFHVSYNLTRVLKIDGRGGEIVIFHTPNKENRHQTVFVLDDMLGRAKRCGYDAVKLTDALVA